MGILSKITGIGRTDPFTVTTTPNIEPTNGPGLDAPALILHLITQLDYDTRQGYRHHDLLAQYTYLLEQRLEDNGITVNGYTDWSNAPRDDQHEHFVYSEQFYADLYDGFPHNTTHPAIRTKRDATRGGDPLLLYSPNGYTDLYIDEYYSHCDTDRETVEQIINTFIDELPGPASNNMTYLQEKYLTSNVTA